jgi:hypothetical protein
MLSFVAQDQTNISADSADRLRVAINKPFREVLGPVALYICVLDRGHFDSRRSAGVWVEGTVKAQPRA